METKIFFTTIPAKTGLKHYKAIINSRTEGYPLFASVFNRQKITARQIIETFDNVFAAPVTGNISQIHLIVSFETFDRNDFFLSAEELNLTLTGPHSLHEAVYLECIRFTLAVKMSPEWNRIQNLFVKREVFSKSGQPIDAVQLQMLLSEECLCVLLKPLRLKLSELNLMDLNVGTEELDKANCVEIQKKVFVLPDLKPAMALRIYSKLPKSCPFSNYSDIREYWRVLHGYEFPESGQNMPYVEVSFSWSNMTYIYPILGVCSHEPLLFPHRNESIVFCNFLAGMEKNFPKIFGYPFKLKIDSNDSYRTVAKLHQASEVFINPFNLVKSFDSNFGETHRNLAENEAKTSSYNSKNSKSEISIARFSTSLPKTSNETFKCCQKFTPKFRINYSADQPPKPAKKCKFQTGSHGREFEIAARSKTLTNFTVSTLMEFCKKNQIKVNSKEKKIALMQKIYSFFSQKQPST